MFLFDIFRNRATNCLQQIDKSCLFLLEKKPKRYTNLNLYVFLVMTPRRNFCCKIPYCLVTNDVACWWDSKAPIFYLFSPFLWRCMAVLMAASRFVSVSTLASTGGFAIAPGAGEPRQFRLQLQATSSVGPSYHGC